ncbi:inactive tyrosine-protein kinase PEAK1 [Siniperca chuatsi]|uniref:inactive tyrosine-protein kinase PEAK1 n=1 Tax=Siniperca chuatsi TaxID=119488 RepID=UPI001CE03CD1|nr:inactive tyrosine-protein kinase PEAK1 [Siniperca chuatsi]XP_044050046.1 inactive tyrosine-protein kinase PEAK1 [Siniperca chuatsi]XP_044050047.1 inactive tyrosine-protein kinase PEAK1 [Siniperca chuatsi]XP_044050048.1 inactive tyrosine-protein kinase PEAK1 [Siniperca chuatsi]XP_044050049.1 inactive tyrosine-protein kinase PEAK1 [Siniperca chuatsi]XP_044050050.1 inactive tyrosine-protein kinase PEAK1 [Siniperca chuatsi]XP_044050051.1 inactive tyrosine-protein kinase PEAK1 [Siniperca chuats
MSACSTFTEHVWKPGECKNCFKPKSLHCLVQSSGGKPPSEHRPPTTQQQNPPPAGARANPNLTNNSQRAGSGSARSGHFRPPVAKKPTIAVKPTMMLPCSSAGLDSDGNLQRPPNVIEHGKTSAFTVWNCNGLNRKRPGGPSNNNEGEDGREEIEGYAQLSPRTPSGNNNNSGLTDVLKEIAGLCPGPSPTPLSGSKDLFWGRISSSYRRSLERGLPASSCLAMGSSSSGGGSTAQKRVSLSDSTEIISTEGGRFCYPEFSSEGEDDEEEEDEEEETERDDDEHESWDESDEELLAMEIRMRGQPRFANFRAATLSPVHFTAGKKWNTVPLRNRSLQRICAVDYDDSYDEILNGYPSMDSNGALLPYGPYDMQGSGFLSNSESTTSPESSSSLPEDSRTTSSSGSSAPCALRNGLHSPTSSKAPVPCTSPPKKEPVHRALSPLKVTETHKAVLAIRLEDQDGREGTPMPQALPGQPVTISFSPTEEQARPYRVVNLEKSLICKPYTVVDVSASMANKDEQIPDSTPKPKNLSVSSSPTSFCSTPLGQPLSPTSPVSPSSPVMPTSPTSVALSRTSRKKSGSIRYQEVWTSSTSPRQKIPKVDLGVGSNPGPSIPTQHCSHKSAPTSPIAGLSSSRTVPVKSPNLSEIKFNSFNNAGMPPFPIIIRDEPAYARSSKNAVKVPIVINPSAYDNLAVYKSFLGLSGELPQPKGVGSRVASHTYEEIGSSESVQSSSTEKTISGRGTSERASFEETKAPPEAVSKAPNLQPRTTTDSSTVTNTVMSSTVGVFSPTTSTNSPAILAITANLPKTSPTANAVTRTCKTSGDAACSQDDDTDLTMSSGTVASHREEASAVLLQIVASIQPPQSPPESPSAQAKTPSSEELYALPPDAMKETLTRPKSLFSTTDGCLSKPKKDTPSKVLSKSQSASAAVPLSSPRSEPNAPFPPPRSTSSPYHASNILQRHFGNWTKSSASSSPVRPSEGEASPGGEGRRILTESSKPKRWISFKSFFRRRKDEDEQKERLEREKEKGKLVGLDGTVIHMLPPPPIQHHHWFTEAKPEDPTQKPTIIFTYKPDSGSTPGDGEGELQVEECRETALLTPDESKEPRPLSPGQTPPSHNTGCDLISKDFSQVPVSANNARDRELPGAASLPAKVNLGLVLGEGEEGHANQVATPASASEGSASLGEPEEDGNHSHHSHSTASSQCSATYSNLGQSRANMIPLKQPRNIKASNDTLASIDLDGLAEQPAHKATPPPPLPKKAVPRSSTEPSLGGKEVVQGALRPRAEAKPGGTNLSVANPLYDLDSTWEIASQSSSLSSEPHRAHDHESGDSLERPSAATATNKGRPTNSVSSLVPQPASAAPSATTSRERRAYPSTESLAGRGGITGRGAAAGGGGSKPQRPGLYRGLDSWDEVVGRIRGLHTDTLRKLASKCEDRFMAGQKDHLRFGTDSWSHFRLTTGKPCCEAGDAVYYTASYAKDPLVNYAIKICRSKVKETQQQFFHSLAVRQSLAVHFNIQQDCGHFLADVPTRLLPWEEEEDEEEEENAGEDGNGLKEKEIKVQTKTTDSKAPNGKLDETPTAGHMNTTGHLKSRVVVITREVPFQTVADFVREGLARHTHNPELYERQVCLLLLQLCSGLEHMKPYHVTHCDLRLENLLLVHCQPGNPWNLDILEPNNNSNSSSSSGATSASAAAAAANATCPARLIISNFSQAKQKSTLMAADPGTLRDQSRLAPEIVTATQYRKCDEFQTGILIYEMLHRPNPFEETPELKEREYTWADLPPLPVRSLYSQGLQQLARLLLTVNPSERIRMSEARACLQCLLWGPREDLFQALGCSSTGPMSGATSSQREATLQNWLDLKRTLMMIKFAERSLDVACGVSLEDWLCCQYLAFATTDTLSRVVHILQQPQPHPQSQKQSQPAHAAQNQTQTHLAHNLHLTQSQPL